MGTRCPPPKFAAKGEHQPYAPSFGYTNEFFTPIDQPLLQSDLPLSFFHIPYQRYVKHHMTGLACFSAGHIQFVPFPLKPPSPWSTFPVNSSLISTHPTCFMGQLPDDNTAHCQWLLTQFCADLDPFATLYNFSPHRAGPYRTYNGCAHVTLVSTCPAAVIHRLHKRVLFDREGVWYANDELGMAFLQAYGKKICKLPQTERHALLPHLPHRLLTFEPAMRRSA